MRMTTNETKKGTNEDDCEFVSTSSEHCKSRRRLAICIQAHMHEILQKL